MDPTFTLQAQRAQTSLPSMLDQLEASLGNKKELESRNNARSTGNQGPPENKCISDCKLKIKQLKDTVVNIVKAGNDHTTKYYNMQVKVQWWETRLQQLLQQQEQTLQPGTKPQPVNLRSSEEKMVSPACHDQNDVAQGEEPQNTASKMWLAKSTQAVDDERKKIRASTPCKHINKNKHATGDIVRQRQQYDDLHREDPMDLSNNMPANQRVAPQIGLMGETMAHQAAKPGPGQAYKSQPARGLGNSGTCDICHERCRAAMLRDVWDTEDGMQRKQACSDCRKLAHLQPIVRDIGQDTSKIQPPQLLGNTSRGDSPYHSFSTISSPKFGTAPSLPPSDQINSRLCTLNLEKSMPGRTQVAAKQFGRKPIRVLGDNGRKRRHNQQQPQQIADTGADTFTAGSNRGSGWKECVSGRKMGRGRMGVKCSDLEWQPDIQSQGILRPRRMSKRQLGSRDTCIGTEDNPIALLSDDDDHGLGCAVVKETFRPRRTRAFIPTGQKFEGLKCVYPPPGDKDRDGAVEVTASDLARLDREEFLNDTVIDFYLRWLRRQVAEQQGAEAADRCYFFNSFFYKKLTENNGGTLSDELVEYKKQQQMKPAEVQALRNHHKVKNWTKLVDIFSKDYLIVPLHDALHWSLAIICHPGVEPTDDPNAEKTPCILHLDSMQGNHDSEDVMRTLRMYLAHEWYCKSGPDCQGLPSRWQRQHPGKQRVFTKDTMPFLHLKVPQQSNCCDCGLFLCVYAEFFLHSIPPGINFHRLRSLKGYGTKHSNDLFGNSEDSYPGFLTPRWFLPCNASNLRHELRRMILRLMAEQGSYAVREGPSQGGPSRWPAGDSRATGEQLHFPSDQELGELEAAKQEMTRRLKAELSELEAQCLQDRHDPPEVWLEQAQSRKAQLVAKLEEEKEAVRAKEQEQARRRTAAATNAQPAVVGKGMSKDDREVLAAESEERQLVGGETGGDETGGGDTKRTRVSTRMSLAQKVADVDVVEVDGDAVGRLCGDTIHVLDSPTAGGPSTQEAREAQGALEEQDLPSLPEPCDVLEEKESQEEVTPRRRSRLRRRGRSRQTVSAEAKQRQSLVGPLDGEQGGSVLEDSNRSEGLDVDDGVSQQPGLGGRNPQQPGSAAQQIIGDSDTEVEAGLEVGGLTDVTPIAGALGQGEELAQGRGTDGAEPGVAVQRGGAQGGAGPAALGAASQRATRSLAELHEEVQILEGEAAGGPLPEEGTLEPADLSAADLAYLDAAPLAPAQHTAPAQEQGPPAPGPESRRAAKKRQQLRKGIQKQQMAQRLQIENKPAGSTSPAVDHRQGAVPILSLCVPEPSPAQQQRQQESDWQQGSGMAGAVVSRAEATAGDQNGMHSQQHVEVVGGVGVRPSRGEKRGGTGAGGAPEKRSRAVMERSTCPQLPQGPEGKPKKDKVSSAPKSFSRRQEIFTNKSEFLSDVEREGRAQGGAQLIAQVLTSACEDAGVPSELAEVPPTQLVQSDAKYVDVEAAGAPGSGEEDGPCTQRQGRHDVLDGPPGCFRESPRRRQSRMQGCTRQGNGGAAPPTPMTLTSPLTQKQGPQAGSAASGGVARAQRTQQQQQQEAEAVRKQNWWDAKGGGGRKRQGVHRPAEQAQPPLLLGGHAPRGGKGRGRGRREGTGADVAAGGSWEALQAGGGHHPAQATPACQPPSTRQQLSHPRAAGDGSGQSSVGARRPAAGGPGVGSSGQAPSWECDLVDEGWGPSDEEVELLSEGGHAGEVQLPPSFPQPVSPADSGRTVSFDQKGSPPGGEWARGAREVAGEARERHGAKEEQETLVQRLRTGLGYLRQGQEEGWKDEAASAGGGQRGGGEWGGGAESAPAGGSVQAGTSFQEASGACEVEPGGLAGQMCNLTDIEPAARGRAAAPPSPSLHPGPPAHPHAPAASPDCIDLTLDQSVAAQHLHPPEDDRQEEARRAALAHTHDGRTASLAGGQERRLRQGPAVSPDGVAVAGSVGGRNESVQRDAGRDAFNPHQCRDSEAGAGPVAQRRAHQGGGRRKKAPPGNPEGVGPRMLTCSAGGAPAAGTAETGEAAPSLAQALRHGQGQEFPQKQRGGQPSGAEDQEYQQFQKLRRDNQQRIHEGWQSHSIDLAPGQGPGRRGVAPEVIVSQLDQRLQVATHGALTPSQQAQRPAALSFRGQAFAWADPRRQQQAAGAQARATVQAAQSQQAHSQGTRMRPHPLLHPRGCTYHHQGADPDGEHSVQQVPPGGYLQQQQAWDARVHPGQQHRHHHHHHQEAAAWQAAGSTVQGDDEGGQEGGGAQRGSLYGGGPGHGAPPATIPWETAGQWVAVTHSCAAAWPPQPNDGGGRGGVGAAAPVVVGMTPASPWSDGAGGGGGGPGVQLQAAHPANDWGDPSAPTHPQLDHPAAHLQGPLLDRRHQHHACPGHHRRQCHLQPQLSSGWQQWPLEGTGQGEEGSDGGAGQAMCSAVGLEGREPNLASGKGMAAGGGAATEHGETADAAAPAGGWAPAPRVVAGLWKGRAGGARVVCTEYELAHDLEQAAEMAAAVAATRCYSGMSNGGSSCRQQASSSCRMEMQGGGLAGEVGRGGDGADDVVYVD